jgi:hypothetical protein
MKNRLTTLREKTGWTPAELADFVGTRGTELFPPVPTRVRLEELAARPWYVRLFFD